MDPALAKLRNEVKAAAARHRPLRIRGGGTRAFYGNPWPEADAGWLELSEWRGIVHYEPSELVLTARAGTPLAEVEATLATAHQMLAFEPPRFGAADTLGGCIATGLSGPRRVAAGRVADFVLGTRLLDARGEVLRFGGEVMKNVAGYDVSRLLAGSLGILGPLVEVSVKVVPMSRVEATVTMACAEVDALQRCLVWRSQPLPVSATAWFDGVLTVRLSGSDPAVRTARTRIGGDELSADAAAAFWASLRDQTHPFFARRPLWRVVLPPKAPPLALGPTLVEWSGGQRWIAGARDAAALRQQAAALGGSACLYRRDGTAAPAVGAFQEPPAAILKIHRRLKHEFDPDGIFNRGRMFAGF